jgi:1-acyl-sn-glycerol-3-phosphate acyltransferase
MASHAKQDLHAKPVGPTLGHRLRYGLARLVLAALGWHVEGTLPDCPSCVVITTHSSNWDYLIALCMGAVLSQGLFTFKLMWLGKKEAFRGPLGVFYRWTGGLPIDRQRREGVVEQAVQAFSTYDDLYLAIAPEGTRGKVGYWRSGFYVIARQAGVPIACMFVDYARKAVGFGPLLMPGGDAEADLAFIRGFYAGVTPRHPDKVGPIRWRPGERGSHD